MHITSPQIRATSGVLFSIPSACVYTISQWILLTEASKAQNVSMISSFSPAHIFARLFIYWNRRYLHIWCSLKNKNVTHAKVFFILNINAPATQSRDCIKSILNNVTQCWRLFFHSEARNMQSFFSFFLLPTWNVEKIKQFFASALIKTASELSDDNIFFHKKKLNSIQSWKREHK